MPSTPSAEKNNDVDTLIQEFQHFTKDWAHRLSQIEATNSENTVTPQVVKDLLTLLDGSSKNQGTLQHRIQVFVSSHMHQGLTLKDLSDFFGYSEKYCSEFFRQHMGESFSSYLKGMRIRRAKMLLGNALVGMTEIAEALGFRDQFAFSHFFKKAIGMSPREYRNKIVKEESYATEPASYSSV